jgi:hypothetical protein
LIALAGGCGTSISPIGRRRRSIRS